MAKKVSDSRFRKFLFRKNLLQTVIIILLLIIIWLLLGSAFKWWPWNTSGVPLGSAFYSNSQPAKDSNSTDDSDSNSEGDGSGSGGTGTPGPAGSNGTNGANGSNGTNGTNNGGGSTNTTSALITFAGGVNTGDSKQEVSGSAGGLNENCTVIVNTTAAGKQEVCTYTEGDKIVTVTYLNDRVISASRSGF